MGGLFAGIGVLAAIIERKRTGRGQYLQSSLYENTVFLVAQHMMQYLVTGKPASPMPSRLSAWAIYDVFGTEDGESVFVGVVSDSQWKAFCEAFGFVKLAADPTLALNNQRVHARERFLPFVREQIGNMTKQEIMDTCERAGLPYAPIMRPQDLFDDPHLNGSHGFADITLADGRAARVPMLPLEMDGRRLDVPKLGSHTVELLAELGYSADDARRMTDSGIVKQGTGETQ